MRRKLLRAAVVILLGVAVCLVWIAVRPGPLERMAEFVTELRARGTPVTLAEMDAPMPDPADNGAADYERALAWLDSRLGATWGPDGEAWDQAFVGEWNLTIARPWHEHATEPQTADLQHLLDDLQPFFSGLASAATKREIAWPPRNTSGVFLWDERDAYATWRRARQLVEARARAGRTADDRLDALALLIALDRRFRCRSGLEFAVFAQVRARGCVVLRDVMERGGIEPREAHRRLDELLRGPGAESMSTLLRAVVCEGIVAFPEFLDGTTQIGLTRQVRRLDALLSNRTPSVWERARNRVEDALVGARVDWRGYIAMLRATDALARAETPWTDTSEDRLRTLEAEYGRVASINLRFLRWAVAAESLARVALALQVEQETSGAWPESLADIQRYFPDGIPLDPYTGLPFVLEREGDVLVVRAQPPQDALLHPYATPREAALVWRLTPR